MSLLFSDYSHFQQWRDAGTWSPLQHLISYIFHFFLHTCVLQIDVSWPVVTEYSGTDSDRFYFSPSRSSHYPPHAEKSDHLANCWQELVGDNVQRPLFTICPYFNSEPIGDEIRLLRLLLRDYKACISAINFAQARQVPEFYQKTIWAYLHSSTFDYPFEVWWKLKVHLYV